MNQIKENTVYKAWFIWLVATSYFFVGYFVRVSLGVMTVDLMRDLQANASKIGLLATCFYIPYILNQMFVGVLVDRFNPQRILGAMAFCMALAVFWFASADSIFIASISRIVIGATMAFAFVGAIKLASSWMPSSKFGLIVGLTQASGMLAAGFGAIPLARAVSTYGWRMTSNVLAMGLVVIAVSIVLWAKYNKANISTAKGGKPKYSLWESFYIVIKNPQSWYNGLFIGLLYIPTGVLAEGWGIPYLQQVRAFSLEHASFLNGLIFVGWVFGGPLWGIFSERIGRRRICLVLAAILSVITFATIIYIPSLSFWMLGLMLFLLGIANSGVTIGYTVGGEINSKEVLGTSLAFANMCSIFIGSSILVPIMGYILDHVDIVKYVDQVPVYSQHAYSMAFSVTIIGVLLALLFVFKVKETYCKFIEE